MLSDDQLKAIGIPREFWSYQIDSELRVERSLNTKISNYPPKRKPIAGPIKFRNVVVKPNTKESVGISIDTGEQRDILVKLITQDALVGTSTKILMTSSTDEIPKIVLSVLAKKYGEIYGRSKYVRVIGPSAYSEKPVINEDLKFLGIYNVFNKSNDYRLQDIRDLITSVTCPVVIAAGGVDPVVFCNERLHLRMDLMFNFADSLSI